MLKISRKFELIYVTSFTFIHHNNLYNNITCFSFYLMIFLLPRTKSCSIIRNIIYQTFAKKTCSINHSRVKYRYDVRDQQLLHVRTFYGLRFYKQKQYTFYFLLLIQKKEILYKKMANKICFTQLTNYYHHKEFYMF